MHPVCPDSALDTHGHPRVQLVTSWKACPRWRGGLPGRIRAVVVYSRLGLRMMLGVDDWVGWEDPAELRVRLDMALEEIDGLREENTRLRSLLGPVADVVPAHDAVTEDSAPERPQESEPVIVAPQMLSSSGLPYADASSGGQEKVALFRALFVGRGDVYARPWVNKKGRSGWSPATEKPPWDLSEGEERVLLPLTDRAPYEHPTRSGHGEEV